MFRLCTAILFILSGLSPALAQTIGASISGIVLDESGGILRGAMVKTLNSENGSVRSAVSDDHGRYSVLELTPGSYEVSAELPGFKTVVKSGVKLDLGQDTTVRFSLPVGEISDQVRVFGDISTVETTTSELSGLVDDLKIRDLPLNGRSFVQLSFLQPNIVEFKFGRPGNPSSRASAINVNGLRPTSNAFLLDGTFINDAIGRSPGSVAGLLLGIDAVQEFRVMTNSYGAEYGMAAGGVVNVITKTGTNMVHGSGFGFHRNDNLDARNFFDLEKPEFRRNQFGGTVGGPIFKDRTFFFGAAEWLRQLKGITRVSHVPSLAARNGELVPIADSVKPYLNLFPLPSGPDLGGGLAEHRFAQDEVINQSYYQVRLDHAISSNDLLFGRYTLDDSTAVRSAPTPNTLAVVDDKNRGQYFTLGYTKILTASKLNTARFAFNRTMMNRVNRFLQPVDASLSFVEGRPVGILNIGGIGEWGPGRYNPSLHVRNLYSFSDEFSLIKGRHNLKMGGTINRFQDARTSSNNLNGTYDFPSVVDFLEGNAERFQTLSATSSNIRHWRQWLFGFYLQDDFRATPRITLNFGLRYEFTTVMKEAQGRVQNLRDVLHDSEMTLVDPLYQNPSLRNLMPRFGFAWDTLGTGRSVIRGGFGIFFDPYLSHYIWPGHNLAPPYTQSVFIRNPSFPRHPMPSNFPNQFQSIQISDFHAQNPYSIQYNLNFQHETWRDIVLTLGYAGSRGVNLVRGGPINSPYPEIVDGRKYFPAGAPRRNPNWSNIDLKRGDGNSWYNALVLSAQKRFSEGCQFQISYTFSKTMDEGSGMMTGDTATGVINPQDPDDRGNERGLAAFHMKHNLSLNYTFDLPGDHSLQGLAGTLLGGWQASGITTIRSGAPFTIGVQADRSRARYVIPGQIRPDLIAGSSMEQAVLGSSGFKQTGRYFDPTIFTLQPAGFFGNVGRNTLIGPNLINFDFSLVKNHRASFLGENGNIQLRAEFFNVFNRANFAPPNPLVFAGTATSPDPACELQYECPMPSAGRITSTATDSRQIQLGVKILF